MLAIPIYKYKKTSLSFVISKRWTLNLTQSHNTRSYAENIKCGNREGPDKPNKTH